METEDSDRINAILPDDLMVEILRRLKKGRDRSASSLVCKRWLSLLEQSIETIHFYQPEKYATLHRLKLLSWCFVNVRDISIFEFQNENASVQNDMDFLSDSGLAVVGDGFPKLESLSLDRCPYVTCAGLISIAEKCKWLKSLVLEECYIGDKGVAAIGKYCTRLENLDLWGCDSLTDSALIKLARGCGRTLKSLGLGSRRVTDFSIKAVGFHCVYLETLSLHSKFINNEGLLSIAKGCPLLKSLELHCINVTVNHLSEPVIKVERFQQLENNARDQIAVVWNCLQSLCLIGIGDKTLHFLTTGCTNLKKLDMHGCPKVGNEGIISIAQNCKFLTDLNLRFCSQVGDAGIIAIATGCPQLSYLNVQGMEALGDEGLAALGEGYRL